MVPSASPAEHRLQEALRRELTAVEGAGSVETWEAADALGASTMAAPAEEEGLGLGERGLALLFEELGRAGCDHRTTEAILLADDHSWRSATSTTAASLAATGVSLDRLLNEELGTPATDGGAEWSVYVDRAARLPTLAAHSARRGTCELQRGPGVAAALPHSIRRGRIRQAAYLLGLASRALIFATRRSRSRRIAGRPLVEHQAVAHRLARACLRVDGVRLQVRRAAWLEDEQHGSDVVAQAAQAMAAEAAAAVSRDAAHLWGAAGSSEPALTSVHAAAHRELARWQPPHEVWVSLAAARNTTITEVQAA